MWFFDSLFRKIKITIAGTGTILSTIGIITSTGPLSLFVSSVFLATSLFVAYDGTAVAKKIKAQVDQLRTQNEILESNVEDLNDLNNNLEKTARETTDNLYTLQGENDELKSTKDDLVGQVQKLHEMHVESKKLIKNLVMAGDQFNKFGEEFGTVSKELDETQDEMDETQAELNETQEKLDKTNALIKALTQRLEQSSK